MVGKDLGGHGCRNVSNPNFMKGSHMTADSHVAAEMRAVVLTGHGGVDRLEARRVPTPTPGPDDVLVRVGACALNNTDINTRTGWYDRKVTTSVTEDLGLRGRDDDAGYAWTKVAMAFPRIQGASVAGSIAAVGSDVDESRIGSRVLVDPCIRDASRPLRAQIAEYLGSERDGGFAEYVVVPSINACDINTPLTDAELATFPCSYDTAEEMLARADLQAGETLLITGAAGGVGTALIQLALARDARIIAVASASKEAALLELGAHHFVPRDGGDLVEAVQRIVGDDGVDVVADVVGGQLFEPIIKTLRRAGRYSTAGAIGGPITSFDLRELIYKDLEMNGVTNPTADTFARLVQLIEAGRIRPVLEQAFPLEELATAQEQMVKRSHIGKFVVTI